VISGCKAISEAVPCNVTLASCESPVRELRRDPECLPTCGGYLETGRLARGPYRGQNTD
jgi:hypothetical protein